MKKLSTCFSPKTNNIQLNQNKQTERTETLHTQELKCTDLREESRLHKVNMRQCCCDSQHAAVAPGAISLSQPLSRSTGREERSRISTLGKKIRASDSNLPCIIPSLRSSQALRCRPHKHHYNCCGKSCNIAVATSYASVEEKKGEEATA